MRIHVAEEVPLQLLQVHPVPVDHTEHHRVEEVALKSAFSTLTLVKTCQLFAIHEEAPLVDPEQWDVIVTEKAYRPLPLLLAAEAAEAAEVGYLQHAFMPSEIRPRGVLSLGLIIIISTGIFSTGSTTFFIAVVIIQHKLQHLPTFTREQVQLPPLQHVVMLPVQRESQQLPLPRAPDFPSCLYVLQVPNKVGLVLVYPLEQLE